jgi:hypothetical protein
MNTNFKIALAVVADLQEPTLLSKNTRIITNMNILWRWRRHSHNEAMQNVGH